MSAHRVTHYQARRAGVWCSCQCGWRSGNWTTITGSHGEFGQHLLRQARMEKGTADEQ